MVLYDDGKQACKLAIDGGWAVNLGGGFGYNTTRISKGLAVYDDIPVCLAVRLYVPVQIYMYLYSFLEKWLTCLCCKLEFFIYLYNVSLRRILSQTLKFLHYN